MAYGRPGVYITERLLPAPLTAGGGTVAAGAAICRLGQGPTDVTLVNSWYEFTKIYGGYDINYPATFGIGQFFKSGGTQLYVRRVLSGNAVAASYAIAASAGTVGTVTALNAGTDGNNLAVKFAQVGDTAYYNVTVTKDIGTTADVIVEQYDNVLFDNDPVSSDFIETVINFASSYIRVTVSDQTKVPSSTTPNALTSGSNGSALITTDFTTALADFNALDIPLVMFTPEVHREATWGASTTAITVQDAIVSYAAVAKNVFVVLDTAADLSVNSALSYAAGRADQSNVAMYYPNVYIADPFGRNVTSVRKCGPAGSVAGLYLATDRAQGPFKAPAGLRAALGGVVALERRFTSTELDSLNSSSSPLNAIRDIPGAGVVVMGARTLLQDGTANRYVSMRRSLIHIQKQLTDLTQFVMFENNDSTLWSRIRTTLGIFLNDYRNLGGLAGSSPDEAFFVKCDRENNPDSDIALGIVNIEVGVSLEYPAEFVVITLSQKTAS